MSDTSNLPSVTEDQVDAYKCIMHASQAKHVHKTQNKQREDLALKLLKLYDKPNELKPLINEYQARFADSHF